MLVCPGDRRFFLSLVGGKGRPIGDGGRQDGIVHALPLGFRGLLLHQLFLAGGLGLSRTLFGNVGDPPVALTHAVVGALGLFIAARDLASFRFRTMTLTVSLALDDPGATRKSAESFLSIDIATGPPVGRNTRFGSLVGGVRELAHHDLIGIVWGKDDRVTVVVVVVALVVIVVRSSSSCCCCCIASRFVTCFPVGVTRIGCK